MSTLKRRKRKKMLEMILFPWLEDTHPYLWERRRQMRQKIAHPPINDVWSQSRRESIFSHKTLPHSSQIRSCVYASDGGGYHKTVNLMDHWSFELWCEAFLTYPSSGTNHMYTWVALTMINQSCMENFRKYRNRNLLVSRCVMYLETSDMLAHTFDISMTWKTNTTHSKFHKRDMTTRRMEEARDWISKSFVKKTKSFLKLKPNKLYRSRQSGVNFSLILKPFL